MRQLTCEMCGSNELVKQDGMYICQSCGTKYSVEEARKMMIEGTVDIKGTVKVDSSAELQNLYELARRAKKDNNTENAQKYYEQILVKDPSSWEANFYSTYYQSMNCKIVEIQQAAIRMSNCEETVLNLIKRNVADPEERKNAVAEVAIQLINIANMLFTGAMNHYDGTGYTIDDTRVRCWAAMEICYNCGDYVIKIFGDEYGKDIAVPCWKIGIEMLNAINKRVGVFKETYKQTSLHYTNQIKMYDSSYQVPETSGCYVATCVYGSYDCPQVWTLRRYRDYTLAKTWYGRAFIRIYYTISPTIVKWFGNTDWFRKFWRGKLDRMVNNLNAKGVKSTPYQDRTW